jgi:hypothetical protein
VKGGRETSFGSHRGGLFTIITGQIMKITVENFFVESSNRKFLCRKVRTHPTTRRPYLCCCVQCPLWHFEMSGEYSGRLSPSTGPRGHGSPGSNGLEGRLLPARSSRLRRFSLNENPERQVTLQDLQEFSRSMEHMIHSKNEVILSKLNELEAQMKGVSMRKCPCGLTQRQLDFYQWVDPKTGRCIARYLSSDGREVTCGQLYTTHDQLIAQPMPIPAPATIPSGEEETLSLPPPPEIISQAVKSEAAARIQRLASRRRAWKTAEAEREWKVTLPSLNSDSDSGSCLDIQRPGYSRRG